MFFTIEPMVNLGRPETKVLADDWTAVTRDKSLSRAVRTFGGRYRHRVRNLYPVARRTLLSGTPETAWGVTPTPARRQARPPPLKANSGSMPCARSAASHFRGLAPPSTSSASAFAGQPAVGADLGLQLPRPPARIAQHQKRPRRAAPCCDIFQNVARRGQRQPGRHRLCWPCPAASPANAAQSPAHVSTGPPNCTVTLPALPPESPRCSASSGQPMPVGADLLTTSPIAPCGECAQTSTTECSNRASPMPGIAISRLPASSMHAPPPSEPDNRLPHAPAQGPAAPASGLMPRQCRRCDFARAIRGANPRP